MNFNDWIQNRWRPITAIVYLVICMFDFVIFPIGWAWFLFFVDAVDKTIGWTPLTLQGAGMFHLSFGAILGVSAFTRGQEKVQRLRNESLYEHEYTPEENTEQSSRRKFEPPRRNNYE